MSLPRAAHLSTAPVPGSCVFSSPQHGAEIQFRGVVREMEKGRKLRGIHYSAYAPMAERLLRDMLHTVSTAHPHALLFVHHVTGFVPAGKASLLIAAATPHSAEAFELVHEILRWIKRELPVWKEFVYEEDV